MNFPVADLQLNPFVPVAVGLVVSLIFGQVGLTGGIATLPFMVSILNFTSPSVSSTNLIFNLISPAGSVYSYSKEKRMLWGLGFFAAAGGILGSLIGPRIRIGPLEDILIFKALFGVVLGLIGVRLYLRKPEEINVGRVGTTKSLFYPHFTFSEKTYFFSPPLVFSAGIIAGVISTTFGIGTGFLLVPFFTAVLRLPIYAVTGAALLSTQIVSASGILVYHFLDSGTSAAPDLKLGFLFGLGGAIGGFLSAKIQRRMPSKILHKILGAILVLWAAGYLRQGF